MQTVLQLWKGLPLPLANLIKALIIIAIFWVLAIIFRIVVKYVNKKKQSEVVGFLGKLVYYIILIIGIVTALGTVGINVSALVASLGLLSFGASYALKDMLSNVIAGVMILLNGTIRNGDHIIIDSFEGKVMKTSLRYTVLKNENNFYYVPNGTFTTKALTIVTQGAS